jgi:hypothetical protein
MKIDLNKIKYYFLTCDREGERMKHMINEFKDYDIKEVLPILNIGVFRSMCIGVMRILDIGLRNQDRTKPFQPFVLFEDDVKKYREFPQYLDVPDHTDILYIGLSIWGMSKDISDSGIHNRIYYNDYDDNLIRIFNMLSAHAILICSSAGALAIQKATMEAYFKNTVHDINIAYLQPYYNVYALKIPLVYQWEKLKGQEVPTKITYKSFDKHDFSEKNINKTNISILSCYDKDN